MSNCFRTTLLGKIMQHLKFRTLLLTALLFGCIDKPQSQFEALSSPSSALLAKIEPYIKPSIDFAYQNEQYAFDFGAELSAEEKLMAKKIGIENVDKIRVVYVNEFPFPKNIHLAKLAKSHGFDTSELGGITYGYGIYIRYGREFLLPHELIHVRQFEKLGIEGFMKRYILELNVMGYRSAPLEVQAYKEAKKYAQATD